MTNDEFIAQAQHDFAALTERMNDLDHRYKFISETRDEIVASVVALMDATNKEIGEIFGISGQRVDQIMKRWKEYHDKHQSS